MPLIILTILTTILLPKLALATVTISEVAWMGGLSSANHEWIELHNNGSEAVSVDSWTFSDSMNLSINLTGTIGPGSYAVLERTSDVSAPGTAFLIYTGALVNTGATLILRDQNGSTIDQVSGGENWASIGGDNVTKETAQYTSSGWVTAEATAGAANKTSSSVTPDSPPTNNSSGSGSGSSNNKNSSSASVNLKNVETKMVLKPEVQKIAYVNQPIPLLANTTGVDDHKNKLVDYQWNFGDTYTEEGKKVSHSYAYPGQYVITVVATYNKEEQVSRHDITVLPVSFSLTRNTKGDIQVNNDSPYDVDISRYRLKGKNEILFPERSIILAKSTVTVAEGRLGVTTVANMVELYDTKDNLITSTLEPVFKPAPVAELSVGNKTVSSNSIVAVSKPEAAADFNFVAVAEATAVEELTEMEIKRAEPLEVESEPDISDSEISGSEPPAQNSWPLFALILLIILAIGAIFFGRPKV